MNTIEIIGLVASIIAIISIVTWNSHKKLQAVIFLVVLALFFLLGIWYSKSDSDNKFDFDKYGLIQTGKTKKTKLEGWQIEVTPISDVKITSAETEFDRITKGIEDSKRAYEVWESYLRRENIARRESNGLSITLNNNSQIFFSDGNPEKFSDPDGNFYPIDYYPDQGFILLVEHFYEGSDNLLVMLKNGYRKKICGTPKFREGNKYFITSGMDIDFGWSCNGINLYSIKKGVIHTEFEFEPGWGPGKLMWLEDNKLVIERHMWHNDDEGYPIVSSENILFEFKES